MPDDGGHRPFEFDQSFNWDQFLTDYERGQRGLPPETIAGLTETLLAASAEERQRIDSAVRARSVSALQTALTAAWQTLHAQRDTVNQDVHLADP